VSGDSFGYETPEEADGYGSDEAEEKSKHRHGHSDGSRHGRQVKVHGWVASSEIH